MINGKRKKAIRDIFSGEQVQCYMLLSTIIIGFVVFNVYPILWTFRWSWFQYDGVPSHTQYVGWDNFVKLFTTDVTYWKTWINTILFTVLKVPIELSLAMFLATLLNRKLKGTGFFRSVFYLPNVISVVIVGLIFSNLFDYFGIINNVLNRMGIIQGNIDWFSTKKGAMTVLLIGAIWNTFGINVMYILAAFSNVPEEIYESAKLDGASGWATFSKITLPMITPVFKTIMLLSIVGTLSVNEYIIVLTNGGPSGMTNTVMSYLTKTFMPGFMNTSQPALGYGCAMSLVTTILFAIIAIVYNNISGKIETY